MEILKETRAKFNITTGINPSTPSNFQEYRARYTNYYREALNSTVNNLAGLLWLERGAPQMGDPTIDLNEAERLFFVAYYRNDKSALDKIVQLYTNRI